MPYSGIQARYIFLLRLAGFLFVCDQEQARCSLGFMKHIYLILLVGAQDIAVADPPSVSCISSLLSVPSALEPQCSQHL